MKILLSTLLIAGLLGTASTAMASTVAGHAKWNGNTGNMSDICAFVDTPTDGTMSFDESDDTWTTTAPAVVELRTRGNNNLTVTSDNLLYQGTTGSSDVVGITVDYTGSTVEMPNGNTLTTNVNSNSIAVGMNNAVGIVTFNIEGTAKHTADVVLAKNTDYHVKHTITCIQ